MTTAILAIATTLQASGQAEVAPTAIRNALAQTSNVQGAPRRTMVLSRVVVEPGAALATHHHLGTQIARVQSGVLTYTVRRGSAVVRRAESDRNPVLVRRIEAGQTARLSAGCPEPLNHIDRAVLGICGLVRSGQDGENCLPIHN